MDWDARGLVDALTYGVDLRRRAHEAEIERVVTGVLGQQVYPEPVARYVAAAQTLMRDGGPVSRESEDEAHLRDFLGRVVDALDARRPWPERAYRRVPAAQRPELIAAPVVLRVPERRRIVEARLGRRFERPTPDLAALVLDLEGGTAVALTASTAPGTPAVDVRALGVPPQDLAELLSRTTGLATEPAG